MGLTTPDTGQVEEVSKLQAGTEVGSSEEHDLSNVLLSPLTSPFSEGTNWDVENSNSPKSSEVRSLPNLINGKENEYAPFMVGPFQVFVQAPLNDTSYISPLMVGRKISQNGVQGVVMVKKVGRKKCSVEFGNYEQANSFVKSGKSLFEGFDIFVPRHLISCMGVVRIDKFIEDEEFGNIKSPYREIIATRRIKKGVRSEGKMEFVPTTWVVLTFLGTRLPKYVSLYDVRLEVSAYTRNVIMCSNCFLYGHVKGNCKSKEKCSKCASDRHRSDSCDAVELFCCHCKETGHNALDKSCPEHLKQKSIKNLMVTHNITFFEARDILEGKDSPPGNLSLIKNLNTTNLGQKTQHFPPPPKNKAKGGGGRPGSSWTPHQN